MANPALLGIGFMVYVGVANTFMLSAVKHVSETLHPFEVSFFRCAFGFLLLLPVSLLSTSCNRRLQSSASPVSRCEACGSVNTAPFPC